MDWQYNVLVKDYLLMGCIGKGTYGTVFLTTRVSDNQLVVLKEVPVDSAKNEKQMEVHNEIKVLSTLSHPFIIKYYESFCDSKFVYIAMEYANNGNLAEYMMKREHYLVPQEEILYFFCQILIGVQHIHSKNIIHRDLKAENILMSGPYGNTIKIGDFGIAKILEKDLTTTIIGTPYYLAPELCENKPYDCKTDVWALGCLLYEMCTHKRAFDATTLIGLVNQIISGNTIPINICYYDPELQNVIDSMLTVMPEKRTSIKSVMQMEIFKSILNYFNYNPTQN